MNILSGLPMRIFDGANQYAFDSSNSYIQVGNTFFINGNWYYRSKIIPSQQVADILANNETTTITIGDYHLVGKYDITKAGSFRHYADEITPFVISSEYIKGKTTDRLSLVLVVAI